VILQRDSARHMQLRRPWNKAFSNEPLLDYGESVVKKAAEFVEILERKCLDTGEGRVELDMAKWIDWFSCVFSRIQTDLILKVLRHLKVRLYGRTCVSDLDSAQCTS
jgi:hypothetical protein